MSARRSGAKEATCQMPVSLRLEQAPAAPIIDRAARVRQAPKTNNDRIKALDGNSPPLRPVGFRRRRGDSNGTRDYQHSDQSGTQRSLHLPSVQLHQGGWHPALRTAALRAALRQRVLAIAPENTFQLEQDPTDGKVGESPATPRVREQDLSAAGG
jgi:hypothetical protein